MSHPVSNSLAALIGMAKSTVTIWDPLRVGALTQVVLRLLLRPLKASSTLTLILSCAVDPEDLDLEFDDWDRLDLQPSDVNLDDTRFAFYQHWACRNVAVDFINTFDEDSHREVRGQFLRGDDRLYQVFKARFLIDRAVGIDNRLDWPNNYYGAGEFQGTKWMRCPESEASFIEPCSQVDLVD